MTLQGGNVQSVDRVCRRGTQTAERRVFKTFADAHQTGHAHAVEVFGQTIDRDDEFDEELEGALGDVALPSRSQHVDAIVDYFG